MSRIERLLGFDPNELAKLTAHIETEKKVHEPGLLEKSAKLISPPVPENFLSQLARGYTGKEPKKLSQEIIIDTIKCLNEHTYIITIPTLAFVLSKQGLDFLAKWSDRGNQRAERDVKLLSELLHGINRELFFGVNIEPNFKQSIETYRRIQVLKNEASEQTSPKVD
jgi:hypothetical protein